MPSLDSVSVDTGATRSVSFAPPEVPAREPYALTPSRGVPVPVGPGRPAPAAPLLVAGGVGEGVDGYPVQPAKVQRPPIRDETLARDRLLDWLHAKIHHRVVLVVAEAGYGKTTLLADFSRRTRLRTLWYRLDETDGNWVSFLWHLVAAGREALPAFAPSTASLLSEIAIAGPSRDAVIETFVRELGSLGDGGAAFILDDYHLVDESEDVRLVMRRVIAGAPERVTFALATRRTPALPLARLRAQGEVAELSTEDLRFDEAETERLFRESYGRPLEPDVLTELSRRTEGWAASLHLVQYALSTRPSNEARRFVRGLSGTQVDVYDFLAEEVVRDLSPDAQAFLMKAALLETVDPQSGSVIAEVGRDEAAREIADAERVGLLSRRGSRRDGKHRFHPLVRDFLQERLTHEIGADGVRALHRRAGGYFSSWDWHSATHHFTEAHDYSATHEVIEKSASTIMAIGQFDTALAILNATDFRGPTPTSEILRSRAAYRRGEVAAALSCARNAIRLGPTSELALANLLSMEWAAGNVTEAVRRARELSRTSDQHLAAIGEVASDLLRPDSADISTMIERLRALAESQKIAGHRHYAGISLLNAASLASLVGDARGAIDDADDALDVMGAELATAELSSARLAKAWGLAHTGRLDEARLEFAAAVSGASSVTQLECRIEMADIESMYGDASLARARLHEAEAQLVAAPHFAPLLHVSLAQLAVREHDWVRACELLAAEANRLEGLPGLAVRRAVLRAIAHVGSQDPDAPRLLDEAVSLSRSLGALFWLRLCQVVEGLSSNEGDITSTCEEIFASDPAYASILAEWVIPHLPRSTSLSEIVLREAQIRPQRWLPSLRVALAGAKEVALSAARVLDVCGTQGDIKALRLFAKSIRRPNRAAFGRGLARRLAIPVYVEDQGRVSLVIGDLVIPGSQIRRKVLTFLCFLLSRPSASATRDQVVDALWPELEPDVAVNSLNQTVYFVRRVLEADYDDDTSAGFVHHDSDIVWLDPELVSSRSIRCQELLRRLPDVPTRDQIDELSELYRGRFALDFEYEEWSVPYRDSLHAGYLQAMETAIQTEISAGQFDRAIRLARRASDVAPEAEELEVSLVRLYRITGAHAAASEQYQHYATVLREELGVEPPPMDAL